MEVSFDKMIIFDFFNIEVVAIGESQMVSCDGCDGCDGCDRGW